jgi:hypothetical protein
MKTYEIQIGEKFKEVNDYGVYCYIGHNLWYCENYDGYNVSELVPKLIKTLIKEKNGRTYYTFEDDGRIPLSIRGKIRANFMKSIFSKELKDNEYDISRATEEQLEGEKEVLGIWDWNVDDYFNKFLDEN